MTWDRIDDILAGKRTGKTVRLRGWVHRQRTAGKMAFVVLRDGTGTIQCTVKGGVADEESLAAAKDALIESSVSLLEGEVAADERAPGGYEVKVGKFVLHQRAEDFPLRGEQGTEFELDNRHLWLRSTQLSTVLRVKHRLYKAIRDFFDASPVPHGDDCHEGLQRFTEVDPSVITTNACEGGSTLFTFDYFGQTAYLSQSAQMYLEGCIFGNPRVYSVTPSFRAEKSRTAKHLTEFHHLEAEAAWWTNEDNMAFQERLVTYLAHDVATHCADELRTLGQDPDKLLRIGTYVEGESVADEPGRRFGRMTYHEAAASLRDMGYEFPDGEDFGVPHEKALTEGKVNPTFITDWPASIKAFYMHEKKGPNGEALVACADLMGPDGFGEIIGGSQRSEDVSFMERRLLEQAATECLEGTSDPADIDMENEPLAEQEWHTTKLDPRKAARVLQRIAGGADFIESMGESSLDEKESALRALSFSLPNRRDHMSLAKHGGAFAIGAGPFVFQEPKQTFKTREEGLDALVEVVRESILSPYSWYFDLRRYGSVPHAGFGLGIERLLRWFTGQEHIRDMLPYPRTPSRAYP